MTQQPTALHIPKINRPLEMFTHADEQELVSQYIRQHRIWESYETQLVCQCIQPGQTTIDIGANMGYFSLLFAALTGSQGRMLAFEPEPTNFDLLQKNIAHNQFNHAEAFNLALSDSNSSGFIYLNHDNRGDHKIFPSEQERDALPIELLEGDAFLEPRIADVHFIKIDTQGSEYQVLKGLRQTLQKNHKYLTILLEYSPFDLRQSHSDPHQLLEFLEPFSFSYAYINHIKRQLEPITRDELHWWIDYTESEPGNKGFINLLISPEPIT